MSKADQARQFDTVIVKKQRESEGSIMAMADSLLGVKEEGNETERLLSPAEVQNIYNIPATTLEKWRSLKIGPQYHKLGKHIRYKPVDVDQWIDSKKTTTTS